LIKNTSVSVTRKQIQKPVLRRKRLTRERKVLKTQIWKKLRHHHLILKMKMTQGFR